MMHRLLTGLLATEPLLHRARRRSSPGVTVLMYHEVLGDDDAEAWTAGLRPLKALCPSLPQRGTMGWGTWGLEWQWLAIFVQLILVYRVRIKGTARAGRGVTIRCQ